MNFFNFDLKKILILLFALSLPLLSINVQQKQDDVPWIAQPFKNLASFAQESFFGFSNGIKETTSLYLNLIQIKKNMHSIDAKNQELVARQQLFDELKLENERLQQLLSFKEKTKMELIAASVIGRDLVVDHNTITINKGLQDGIKHGQAVITINGVLGYVYRPQSKSSHVILITDRYSVVDGLIQRTRASGIVEGKGNSFCILKYVEKTEDVKVGDLVVTGGLDNIFPKGFPVAVVEKVERKNVSVSLTVELRPVVDAAKAEEVFVVTNAANIDLETLNTSATNQTEISTEVPTNNEKGTQ